MASLADLKRAWLLRALGLSNGISEANLETQLYSQINGVAQNKDFKTGLYYPPETIAVPAAGAMTLNQLRCVPFVVGETTTFDRIVIEVTTLGAGGTVRLGIYNDVDGLPGTVELDAGTVDSSSIGNKEININKQLSPGLYWLAAVAQAGVAPSIMCHAIHSSPYIGAAAFSAGSGYSFYALAGVAGALPANPAVVATAGASAPRIALRAA